MTKTFTYEGDLATALDYARWRLDDIDPQASSDSDGSPAPFIWDETYSALFAVHGTQMGMYLAARTIAAKISKEISSFGEAAGIRFTFKDRDYYEQVAEQILAEPPYGTALVGLAKIGRIKRGHTDSFEHYRKFESYPTPCE